MLDRLLHFILPHENNNHRAKILHNSSIAVIIGILLIGSLAINIIQSTNPDVLGVSYSISENELLNLVNQKRQANNLSPLVIDATLNDAARRKAADMLEKNYWAHFSPDGSSSPWNFIRAAGYNYTFAGENLAKGFTDANSIVEAWMNSPTHRDNILSSRYRDVGFAIVPGSLGGEETVLVVEMFGARSSQEVATVAEVQISITPTTSPSIAVSSVSPTISPIPTAALIVNTEENSFPGSSSAVVSKPRVDAAITSKAASTVGLSFIAFAFLMDLLIVERKKIPRIVGHNLDHVILILLFLLFVLLKSKGVII